MTRNCISAMPRFLTRFVLSAFTGTVLLLAPAAGFAHPMGNFSISHYSSIRVERHFIDIRYLIDMAEIPTFQEIQNSGLIANPGDPVARRYVEKQAEIFKKSLTLTLNGHPLDLRTQSAEVIFPPGAGGLPTMKMGFVYRAPVPEVDSGNRDKQEFALYYRDDNFPNRVGWKETVATAGSGVTLINTSVPATDRSLQLSNYPTDLLNSPPQVVEARLNFRTEVGAVDRSVPGDTPTGSSARQSTASSAIHNASLERAFAAAKADTAHRSQKTAARSLDAPPGSASQPVSAFAGRQDSGVPPPPALQANKQSTPQNRFTELMTTRQFGLWFLLVAATIAAGLGALHALEPGHGKTVVAAYLVGSKGTAYHAFLLGLIVTISHTAGVFGLGIVTLYASRYIVPEQLYPWLGAISGLLIAALGSYLFLQRYAGREVGHSHGPGGHHHHHHHGHDHVHTHADEDGHIHSHDGHAHSHDAHGHHHHDLPRDVSYRQLLALGITGGIVPCPAALVVLLSAVALNRVGFGMFLIVAFSIGLAAVLIAVGLLMVYARRFMTRLRSDGLLITRWLPLASAAVITALGLAIAIRSLVTGGILQIRA